MKKIIFVFNVILILYGCSKDDLSSSDYFKITTAKGKTYTTSYVSKPIPTENGTFSCQYNKPGRIMFWALIDNNNDVEIDISLPTVPVLNKVYKTNYSLDQEVYFGIWLDNDDVDPNGECTSQVVFSSFTYPGLIQGTIKLSKPDGSILVSGEFNFISK